MPTEFSNIGTAPKKIGFALLAGLMTSSSTFAVEYQISENLMTAAIWAAIGATIGIFIGLIIAICCNVGSEKLHNDSFSLG